MPYPSSNSTDNPTSRYNSAPTGRSLASPSIATKAVVGQKHGLDVITPDSVQQRQARLYFAPPTNAMRHPTSHHYFPYQQTFQSQAATQQREVEPPQSNTHGAKPTDGSSQDHIELNLQRLRQLREISSRDQSYAPSKQHAFQGQVAEGFDVNRRYATPVVQQGNLNAGRPYQAGYRHDGHSYLNQSAFVQQSLAGSNANSSLAPQPNGPATTHLEATELDISIRQSISFICEQNIDNVIFLQQLVEAGVTPPSGALTRLVIELKKLNEMIAQKIGNNARNETYLDIPIQVKPRASRQAASAQSAHLQQQSIDLFGDIDPQNLDISEEDMARFFQEVAEQELL